MIKKQMLFASCLTILGHVSFALPPSPRLAEKDEDSVQIFVTNKLPYEATVRGVYIAERKNASYVDIAKLKKTYDERIVPAEKINFPLFFARKKKNRKNEPLILVRIEGIDTQKSSLVATINEWELRDSIFSMKITDQPCAQSATKTPLSSSSSEGSSLASIAEVEK